MLARDTLADQRLRFLIVGATNTAIGFAAFALLDVFVFADLAQGHLASLAGAYAVSITIAFLLYRRFVFHVTGHVGRDFVAFLGVNAFAIGTNFLILGLLVSLMGLPALGAQAVAVTVTVILSYVGHREVSFRR